MQNTQPGRNRIGDTATGPAYTQEIARTRDGCQGYAIYHDRYRRTSDGWRFTERVCEVRYLDTTPLGARLCRRRATPDDPRPGAPQANQEVT